MNSFLFRLMGGNCILNHLDKIEQLITTMATKIQDFAAKQNARNDAIDAAVAGIAADIAALNATIEKFQNTSGAITAEDQALLDALEVRGDAVAAKLAAMDAQTPGAPVGGSDVGPEAGVAQPANPDQTASTVTGKTSARDMARGPAPVV